MSRRAVAIATFNSRVICINSSFVLNGCVVGFGLFSRADDDDATCPPAARLPASLFSGGGCGCSTGVDSGPGNPLSAGDSEGAPDNSSFAGPAAAVAGRTGASDSEGGILTVAACRLYAGKSG